MALEQLISDLRGDGQFMAAVEAWRVLPAQPPRTVPLPGDLHPVLTTVLPETSSSLREDWPIEAGSYCVDGMLPVMPSPWFCPTWPCPPP